MDRCSFWIGTIRSLVTCNIICATRVETTRMGGSTALPIRSDRCSRSRPSRANPSKTCSRCLKNQKITCALAPRSNWVSARRRKSSLPLANGPGNSTRTSLKINTTYWRPSGCINGTTWSVNRCCDRCCAPRSRAHGHRRCASWVTGVIASASLSCFCARPRMTPHPACGWKPCVWRAFSAGVTRWKRRTRF